MLSKKTITGFSLVALCFALAPAGVQAGSKVKVGKNPGETKGRWLEVDAEKLKAFTQVAIGDVETKIHRKKGKETPIDEELLADQIKNELMENLNGSGLFDKVLREAPDEKTPGMLRLDADLEVEPGSRTARYVVGFGAGKSKSILEIHLRDHETGEEIGLYHGYGVGTGMGFKVAGGGSRKMTQDDIQENAKKFAELLAEVK